MDLFEALAAARTRGQRAATVTVLAVEGDAPSYPGAKLLVAGGAVLAGTLGCSEFDTAGVEVATEALAGDAATLRRRVVFGHGRERALDLFAELHEPRPAVVVAGDTPVGRALATLADLLGRRSVLTADPLAQFAAAPVGRHDAVVFSDHDAPYVEEALRVALASEAFFVGMLGSRRHAPEVVAQLRAAGVPEKQVRRLHSPCGLDIGSRTPEEIALSIVAEIVATERGRSGASMQLDWSAG